MIMSSFLSTNLCTSNMSIFRVVASPIESIVFANSSWTYRLFGGWRDPPRSEIALAPPHFPAWPNRHPCSRYSTDHMVSKFTSRHTTQRRKIGASSGILKACDFRGPRRPPQLDITELETGETHAQTSMIYIPRLFARAGEQSLGTWRRLSGSQASYLR